MEQLSLESTLDLLRKQLAQTQTAIKRCQKQISLAPAGTLRINNKKRGVQFYQRLDAEDTIGTYIPRKDHAIAAALAQKDYDTKLLAELIKQQKANRNSV